MGLKELLRLHSDHVHWKTEVNRAEDARVYFVREAGDLKVLSFLCLWSDVLWPVERRYATCLLSIGFLLLCFVLLTPFLFYWIAQDANKYWSHGCIPWSRNGSNGLLISLAHISIIFLIYKNLVTVHVQKFAFSKYSVFTKRKPLPCKLSSCELLTCQLSKVFTAQFMSQKWFISGWH